MRRSCARSLTRRMAKISYGMTCFTSSATDCRRVSRSREVLIGSASLSRKFSTPKEVGCERSRPEPEVFVPVFAAGDMYLNNISHKDSYCHCGIKAGEDAGAANNLKRGRIR